MHEQGPQDSFEQRGELTLFHLFAALSRRRRGDRRIRSEYEALPACKYPPRDGRQTDLVSALEVSADTAELTRVYTIKSFAELLLSSYDMKSGVTTISVPRPGHGRRGGQRRDRVDEPAGHLLAATNAR